MSTADLPDATEPEEVASAILDGEATPAELARADEPAVAAALAAFRRVAEGVVADVGGAEVGGADELARERAIGAALATWGTEADGARPTDELARRRQARRGLGLVGVAAAVLAALAIGGLAQRDDEPAADTAASAPEAQGEAGAGGATASEAPAADGALFAALDLGTFDDVESLVAAAVGSAAARDAANDDDAASDSETGVAASAGSAGGAAGDEAVMEEGGGDAAAAPAASALTCAPPPPPPGSPRTTSTATLAGRPVVVVVAGSGEDAVVQVTDAQTCELRYEGPAG